METSGRQEGLILRLLEPEVTIAQRLASLTKDSRKILITEAVYNDVKDVFPVVKEVPWKLRGIDDEVTLFSIQAGSVVLA